jgi:hypothetical protein
MVFKCCYYVVSEILEIHFAFMKTPQLGNSIEKTILDIGILASIVSIAYLTEKPKCVAVVRYRTDSGIMKSLFRYWTDRMPEGVRRSCVSRH